jgi:hypothetical protein
VRKGTSHFWSAALPTLTTVANEQNHCPQRPGAPCGWWCPELGHDRPSEQSSTSRTAAHSLYDSVCKKVEVR